MLLVALLLWSAQSALATGELHRYVSMGSLQKVKEAVEAGANINSQDQSGFTPLMAATLGGKPEIAEYLLHMGADFTIKENMGYTPMHGAGFQGRAALIPILLSFGLERDPFHEDGYAPIHRACWGNEPRHTEAVRAFLKAGTSPTLLSRDGRSPLELTQNEGTKKVLHQFISKVL